MQTCLACLLALTLMLTSMPAICLPAYAKRFGPSYYRGSNFELWTFANGMRQWVSARQAVWNGSHWVDYIFQDLYDAQGKYVVQTGLIAVEIFDYYAKFYDPNMTEVRLYDERFEVQRWKTTGKASWSDIGAQSGTPVYDIATFNAGVNITKSFHSWAGWLNITYTFAESLKHTVTWQSEMGTPQTFQVLQKWSGIVGAKCKHQQGSTNILSATEINGTHFEFLKLNYDLSIIENQWSAREYLQPVTVDLHAQGMKCDFIFSNWTLPDRGTLTIDPTTTTLSIWQGHDSYVDESEPDSHHYGEHYLKTEAGTGSRCRTYIVFDASDIPSGSTVSGSNLSIYSWSGSGAGHNRVDAHGCETTDWAVYSLTWNNKPSYDSSIQSYLTPTDTTWHNFTVTNWVNGRAGGQVGFLLKMNTETGTGYGTLFCAHNKGVQYTAKLYVTYTPAPTIGEFEAPSTVYSDEKFSLSCTVNHNYGVEYFNNVTLEIDASVILKWDNATDTFSEQSDASNLCILFADESAKTSVNSTAYQLTWKISLSAQFPEGSVSIYQANTRAFDSYGQFGSGSQSDLFLFEHTTQVTGAGDVPPTSTTKPTTTIGPVTVPKVTIKIPPWGYWVIGGTIALMGVGALMQSGKKKRRVRGVRTQPKRHKPKRTGRDAKGRFR